MSGASKLSGADGIETFGGPAATFKLMNVAGAGATVGVSVVGLMPGNALDRTVLTIPVFGRRGVTPPVAVVPCGVDGMVTGAIGDVASDGAFFGATCLFFVLVDALEDWVWLWVLLVLGGIMRVFPFLVWRLTVSGRVLLGLSGFLMVCLGFGLKKRSKRSTENLDALRKRLDGS